MRESTKRSLTCEFCPKKFEGNANGLAEKTFHELLHEPELVNKK